MLSNVLPYASKIWSLRTTAVALAIAVGTLPVLGIGATAYYFANRSITAEVLEAKKTQARALADKVNSFMYERYADIQILASQAIIADPRISTSLSVQQKQETLDHYIQDSGIYDNISVADLAGNTILQSSGQPVTGLGERDYFQAVKQTDRPVITKPRKSALTGEFSIFVAAPVKDVTTGKTIAIIRSRMPVLQLDKRIKTIESGTQKYNIIDASGKFLIAHNPSDVGKEVNQQYLFLNQVTKAERADARVGSNQQDKTENVVAIATTQNLEGMPNLNWVALVETDTTVAFQTQRELLLTILAGTIITAIIVSAIAATTANRIAKSLTDIVDVVASSSHEIAATVEQQERIAAQQSDKVNQTTTTMNELSASSQQSAEQAEVAAASARQVLVLVDNRVANEQLAAGNSSLRDKVGQIAEQITRLNEQVHQISNISNLVSDLATQTNMLALSAAVEAVRAGEQGKGFSVVASEIHFLADQSKKSAERINNLIVDIQNATNTTVMVTGEGTKTVEKVVASINKITANSGQISYNVQQQAVAIGQVLAAMNSLNGAAQETASGISQTKVGTQQLDRAAMDLKAMV